MLSLVMQCAVAILGVAMLLAFARLTIGPTLQDRIVAMDLIAALTVGIIIATTAGTGERGLLDAATLIALVGFLGTVAYGWYAQKDTSRR